MEFKLRLLLSFLLFERLIEKKTPSHISPLEISLISQMFLRFFSFEKGPHNLLQSQGKDLLIGR